MVTSAQPIPQLTASALSRHRILLLVPAALGLALLAPLGVYAFIGSFARYAADDFCTAGDLRIIGFWASQGYGSYSPRYTFTFLVSVAESVGPGIVTVLPTIGLVVWLLLLLWSVRQFAASIPWLRSYLFALPICLVVMFTTLQGAPDRPQSLYWQTGMLTYLFPLMLLGVYAGWLQRMGTRPDERSRWWALAISGALPFIAGGLDETYLAAQTAVIGLGIVVSLLSPRGSAMRAVLPHLVAGLVASTLCLGVIMMSPGRSGRSELSGADMPTAMRVAWPAYVTFLRHWLRFSGAVALVCVATPIVLGLTAERAGFGSRPAPDLPAWLVAALGIATLALVYYCFLPGTYILAGDPPGRALVVPEFLMVAYLVFLGFAVLGWAQRVDLRLPVAAAMAGLAVMVVVPVVEAAGTLPEWQDDARYAAMWDAEDAQIRAARAAGVMDVRVPPLPRYLNEDFVGTDPKDWFNQCVARFYDLSSIASTGR